MIIDAIKAAKEAGKVLNGVLAQLPTKDQRIMDEFFRFVDKYEEECSREDSDMDDMLAWRERKQLMFETIIKEISSKSKK